MIGYKKCLYLDTASSGRLKFKEALVTLRPLNEDEVVVPFPSKWHRDGSYTRKYRCGSAEVLDIVSIEDPEKRISCAFSWYDLMTTLSYGGGDRRITMYAIGETVVADSLDRDASVTCSNGIHFFLHKAEALKYKF